jgi:hypothetical protein
MCRSEETPKCKITCKHLIYAQFGTQRQHPPGIGLISPFECKKYSHPHVFHDFFFLFQFFISYFELECSPGLINQDLSTRRIIPLTDPVIFLTRVKVVLSLWSRRVVVRSLQWTDRQTSPFLNGQTNDPPFINQALEHTVLTTVLYNHSFSDISSRDVT